MIHRATSAEVLHSWTKGRDQPESDPLVLQVGQTTLPHKNTNCYSVAISFPEAATLLVGDGDRDFSGAWQKGPLGTRLEALIMRQHSLRVLVRQRGGFLRLLARWDVMMMVIKLWSKGHTYTIPTLGQYLTHAPSHITQAVAAMDSCFTFIRPYQLIRPLYGHLSCVQRPFTTEPSAKHFFKRQLRRHI